MTPVVLTASLKYTSSVCDFDVAAPFRFPCPGTSQTCTRTDFGQWVIGCGAPPLPFPSDFLADSYSVGPLS